MPRVGPYEIPGFATFPELSPAGDALAAPLPRVKDASLSAFKRMGVESASAAKSDHGETIVAKATERDIEIKLESLTPKATRMRVTARNGLFRDTATSAEIVAQIEKALGKT